MALQMHPDSLDARNSADDVPSLLEHQVDEVRGTPERRRDEVQRHLALLRNRQVLHEPEVGYRLVEFRIGDRREGPKDALFELELGVLGHCAPGATGSPIARGAVPASPPRLRGSSLAEGGVSS